MIRLITKGELMSNKHIEINTERLYLRTIAVDDAEMIIEIGTHADLIIAADKLRQQVFIDEQGVPAEEIFDGLNSQATHIVVFDCGTPVATSRVLNDGKNWHIGLVAVDKSKRGMHLGEKVMQASIEHIMSNGGREILLTAQQQVCEFYEKLGFIQSGEVEVFESGFVLVPMKLNLYARKLY